LGFLAGVVTAATLVVANPAGSSLHVKHVLRQQFHVKHRHLRRRVPARLIRRYTHRTWRLEALMGRRPTHGPAAWTRSPRALRFWKHRARRASLLVASPPHRSGWLCIHRYEGSWGDSGDPYWGGLQMDRGFMARYAPRQLLRRGFADRWTALEQMWVAERAFRAGRGYSPWPNTARACGLL
jgi:CubicO group peptidase (beta-lactamase class C family)